MYIQVDRKPNGKYEVIPNVELPEPDITNLPIMGTLLDTYDSAMTVLGMDGFPLKIDDWSSDPDDKWTDCQGDYDSVSHAWFSSNSYNDPTRLDGTDDYVFMKVGDTVYGNFGWKSYIEPTAYQETESGIVVKMDNVTLTDFHVNIESGNEYTITASPRAGFTCFYKWLWGDSYSEIRTNNQSLGTIDSGDTSLVILAIDKTNHIFGYDRYGFYEV